MHSVTDGISVNTPAHSHLLSNFPFKSPLYISWLHSSSQFEKVLIEQKKQHSTLKTNIHFFWFYFYPFFFGVPSSCWEEVRRRWAQEREVPLAPCCYAAGRRTSTFKINCNPLPVRDFLTKQWDELPLWLLPSTWPPASLTFILFN